MIKFHAGLEEDKKTENCRGAAMHHGWLKVPLPNPGAVGRAVCPPKATNAQSPPCPSLTAVQLPKCAMAKVRVTSSSAQTECPLHVSWVYEGLQAGICSEQT